MKALLILTCLFVNVQAFAIFMNGDGFYSVDGGFYRYRGLNEKLERDYDMYRHRFMLNLDIKVSDRVSVLSDVSAFYLSDAEYLGDTGRLRFTQVNADGKTSAQTSVFSNQYQAELPGIQRLYAKYASDFGVLVMGRAPKHFGLGIFYNDGYARHNEGKLWSASYDTTDRISYENQFNSLYVEAGYQKFQETGLCLTCQKQGANVATDDMYGLYGQVRYNPDFRDFAFYWGNILRKNDKTNLNIYLLSLNFHFSKYHFDSETDFVNGSTGDNYLTSNYSGTSITETSRYSLSLFSAIIKNRYMFTKEHHASLDAGFAQGDSDLFKEVGQRDKKIGLSAFNPNVKPALLMFNSPKEFVDGVVYTDRVMNAYFIRPAYHLVTETYGNLTTQALYGRQHKTNPTKDALGNKANLGFEIDVIYSKIFNQYFLFDVGAGVLFGNDAYDSKEGSKKAGYGIRTTFSVLF